MLVETTLFGVRDKVETAIERLKTFEPKEGYWVAISGGADSRVILDLVERSGCKYEAHYSRTTVDPPEVVGFIKKLKNVMIDSPEMTMWELIVDQKCPPDRIRKWCCRYLKEGGGGGRMVVTGVRWEESASRAKRHMTERCMKDKTKYFLHLVIDWSKSDIWKYIKIRNLSYCTLYDEGRTRLGCIMCPQQGKEGMLRDAQNYPKYYQAYIRAFDRMIDVRKAEGKKCTWKNGQECMEWWINNTSKQDAFKDELGLYC